MLEIIIKSNFRKSINKSSLEKAYKSTLTFLNIELSPNVSLYITDDQEMMRYNLEYRGINSSTDVLSFNNEFIDLETGEAYLGDVIISFDTAKQQALEYNHSIEEELQFLVIHGLLHLFGYNHENEIEKKEMWKLQNKILESLNNSLENSFN